MTHTITFNPQKLQNPREIKAFKRYQEVKTEVDKAASTILSQDNIDDIDLDDTKGRVVVDKFRADDETFTGVVDGNTVNLNGRKVEDFAEVYADIRSTYKRDDNGFSLTRRSNSEIAYGRYHGVESRNYKSERFQMNADGTISYTPDSSRSSRGVGEW